MNAVLKKGAKWMKYILQNYTRIKKSKNSSYQMAHIENSNTALLMERRFDLFYGEPAGNLDNRILYYKRRFNRLIIRKFL